MVDYLKFSMAHMLKYFICIQMASEDLKRPLTLSTLTSLAIYVVNAAHKINKTD